MMKQQDKKRYETLVNTIGESLDILHNDYGSAFIISLFTKTNNGYNAIVHSACDCTFNEVLEMFGYLAEEDSNLAKAMGIVAKYIKM